MKHIDISLPLQDKSMPNFLDLRQTSKKYFMLQKKDSLQVKVKTNHWNTDPLINILAGFLYHGNSNLDSFAQDKNNQQEDDQQNSQENTWQYITTWYHIYTVTDFQ